MLTETESVTVELHCDGLATSITERRGLEKVRRQLSSVLRSLAPDNIVSARVSGDRFILSFSPSNREDVARLLRRIQLELVTLMGRDGFSGGVGLEIGELDEAGANQAMHRLHAQRGLVQSVHHSAAFVN